jgi:hypothetical protein|tara:strand:- start:452 stop:940 length:489 start_codon:yes stop_codon:yes gene_type:complete
MTVTTIPTAGIADDAVTIAKASGFGKIGQVQSATLSEDINTTSTSFVATNITDSITPSSTSSKILILINGGRSSYNSGAAEGSTKLYYQVGSGSFSAITDIKKSENNQSGNYGHTSLSFNFLHSPSSTSALTYKVYVKTNANNYYLNSDTSAVNITLIEVLA